MLNLVMADKLKVLVFGNILFKGDNISIKLIPKLREKFTEINFVEFDPIENLQDYGKRLKIIDSVKGIDKVKLLNLKSDRDFEKIELTKSCSMHDFDLGYNLKLLKKMNLIDGVEIICVPMNIKEKEAFNQVQLILRKWVAQLMQGS